MSQVSMNTCVALLFALAWTIFITGVFYSRWKEDRVTIRYWRDAADRQFEENIELKRRLAGKK